MFNKNYILGFGLLLMAQLSFAGTPCVTVQSGNWSDATTWNCDNGQPFPFGSNEITIKSGHTLVLNVDTIAINSLIVEAGGGFDVAASVNGWSLNVSGLASSGSIDLSEATVNLAGDFTINANNIEIKLGAVVGPHDLNLNSNTQIRLLAEIGDNNQPLANLTINSQTQVHLDTSSITTTDTLDMTGDIVLEQNTALNVAMVSIADNLDTAGFDLTVNNSDGLNASAIMGVMSGTGNFIKQGAGIFEVHSKNTLNGNVLVNQGGINNLSAFNTPFISASNYILASGTVSSLGAIGSNQLVLNTLQKLKGSGYCACFAYIDNLATISPGNSPGVLSLDGITMEKPSTLVIELNGTTAGLDYDQLSVDSVILSATFGNGTLSVSLGYVPLIGDQYTIVDNKGSDPVTATFDGLPEGAKFKVDDYAFSISYIGGTGNDIVLTSIATPVIYVDQNAAAMGDGQSWISAFNSLQDALDAATPNNTEEIWVAQGVYYPDEGANQTEDDPLATFRLVEGVSVYGGFNATETVKEQRDSEINVTVLSGDIDQNDVDTDGNQIAETVNDIVADNSYHIIIGSEVDSQTVFDGFTVTAGQALGVLDDDKRGAGMYCGDNSSGPGINATTFIGNYAQSQGAATYGCSQDVRNSSFINNQGNNSGAVSVSGGRYENVLFQGNSATSSGGAIDSLSTDPNSTLNILNSKFIANQASINGGAICAARNISLNNVLFSGNKAGGSGGALYFNGVSNNLTNVTMTGNLAGGQGGAINAGDNFGYSLNLRNSIIWNNQDSSGTNTATASVFNGDTSYNQSYSLVQNYGTGGSGNLDEDPLFLTDTDPSASPTTVGNAHLNINSPAINQGDNNLVSIFTDLDGNARIHDTTVDMGAYEFSSHNLSVTVSGLDAGTLVLQNNGADDLTFNTEGTQPFSLPLANGDDYLVTVFTQPSSPNQTCVVTNPTGTINASDVILNVNCTTNLYFIGVEVSGLDANNSIELTSNSQSLNFTGSGIQSFTPINDATPYAVILTTQPTSPNQLCTIRGGNSGADDGSGTINGADVSISVNCVTQYNVGVDVTGLANGVTLSLLNNSEALDITMNGQFNFATALDDFSVYAVSVATNPSSPNQTCSITSINANGTINGMDEIIDIECTINQYSVGGTLSGLQNGTLTLQNNAVNDLQLSADGVFEFTTKLDDLSSYAVTLTNNTSNPEQSCVISGGNSGQNNGTGDLAGVNYAGIDVHCATLHYVDSNAPTGGDGLSWSTAFDNLQDALDAAIPNVGDGIWVAQGVYYPDEGANQTEDDPLATFRLVEGVSVYGGFNGTETLQEQRDPEINVTVLSGDIDQNDIDTDGNQIAETVNNIVANNSYHIIIGSDVNSQTVFDGFTVTAGQALGVLADDKKGAGMYCGDNSSGPGINATTFIGNYAQSQGAATYGCSQDVRNSSFINNQGNNSGAVSVSGGRYENVLFQGNKAASFGGAIYYSGADSSSTLNILNSKFMANQASKSGGAIRTSGNINLINVLFSGNKAGVSGGALYLTGVSNFLINVTMTGNLAGGQDLENGKGGAIYLIDGISPFIFLRNSIIWNNKDSSGTNTATASVFHGGTTYNQSHSLVQNYGTGGTGNLDEDPLFLIDTAPSASPTTAGNAHLMSVSIAIDAGDGAVVTTLYDLDGEDRIQDAAVDMGAYERFSDIIFKYGFE